MASCTHPPTHPCTPRNPNCHQQLARWSAARTRSSHSGLARIVRRSILYWLTARLYGLRTVSRFLLGGAGGQGVQDKGKRGWPSTPACIDRHLPHRVLSTPRPHLTRTQSTPSTFVPPPWLRWRGPGETAPHSRPLQAAGRGRRAGQVLGRWLLSFGAVAGPGRSASRRRRCQMPAHCCLPVAMQPGDHALGGALLGSPCSASGLAHALNQCLTEVEPALACRR